jgi:glutamate/tyrosine decarboxylase-like PLP-dependent enzyme
MKQRLRLNKYFLDPINDSCDELIKQVRVLDGSIKKLGKANQARIPGVVSEKYESYLKKTSIPKKNQDPEKVMKDISKLFKGAVRWHHPGTMINITPPPLIPAIAATTMTMLFNPNLAIDVSCGGLSVTELEVVKHMTTLVKWDWKKAFGVFTFGGKGTNLYAVKVALNKLYPDFKEKGVRGKISITSTEQGHPCHIEVCDWLGLGRSNCLRLPLDTSGRTDVVKAEKIISSFIEDGGEIPCMIVNGGTTLHGTVDPIRKMVQLRNKLVKKFKLKYIPHLHVDSVLGWVWLFFKDYDFNKNPEKIDQIALQKLKNMYDRVSEIQFADSFGVDFHKTGFCPYLSSIFIAKNKELIDNLGVSKQPAFSELQFGNYSPFTYTLESSRPLNGSVSALVALKSLGMAGFRELISGLVTNSEKVKSKFNKLKNFSVVNQSDENFVILFIITPPELNYSYQEILKSSGELGIKIAKYNHKFYLFLLEKQIIGGSPLAIDFISGYESTQSGIKIGVLKMYPVSPYFNKQYVDRLVKQLVIFKNKFDKVADHFKPKICPHVPKTLVLR